MSMSVVPLPNSFGSRWAFDRVPKTIRWAWLTSLRSVWLALGQNGQHRAVAGSVSRPSPTTAEARKRRGNMVGRLGAGGSTVGAGWGQGIIPKHPRFGQASGGETGPNR